MELDHHLMMTDVICPIELPNVEECDATGDHSSKIVEYKKNILNFI